jgi:hypothetical protein
MVTGYYIVGTTGIWIRATDGGHVGILDLRGVIDFLTTSQWERRTFRTFTISNPGEVIDFQEGKSGTTSR